MHSSGLVSCAAVTAMSSADTALHQDLSSRVLVQTLHDHLQTECMATALMGLHRRDTTAAMKTHPPFSCNGQEARNS